MVELYQKSLGKGHKAGGGYEAHFNITSTKEEATCSLQVPAEPGSDVPPQMVDDYMDTKNTIIEFTSDDVFGDLN